MLDLLVTALQWPNVKSDCLTIKWPIAKNIGLTSHDSKMAQCVELTYSKMCFREAKPFLMCTLPPWKIMLIGTIITPGCSGGGVSSNISTFVHLLFYVSFGNISLKWRHHHCRRLRAAKIRPVSGIYGICVDRDPCRATSAVTRGHGFGVLI